MRGITEMQVAESLQIQTEPQQPPASRQFHLFKSLPRELRLKIWHFATPDPHIITIGQFMDPPPMPILLRVSRESREELLDAAENTEDRKASGRYSGCRLKGAKMFFFRFDVDVLSITVPCELDLTPCRRIWYTSHRVFK